MIDAPEFIQVDEQLEQAIVPDVEPDPDKMDQYEDHRDDEEVNAVFYSEDEYPFDEYVEQTVEADDPTGVRGARCADYEGRRDALLQMVGNDTPTIKVTAVTQEKGEPMYDHRSRAKEDPRPPRGHPSNKVFSIYMNVGGALAHCLIDCGSEGVMVAADYARALRLPLKRLVKPVTLQLACQGSKSMINHGITTSVEIDGKTIDEYFDVANVDYYDVILGVPFLRRHKVKLDFAGDGEITVGNKSYKPGNSISLTGTKTPSVVPYKNKREN